MYQSIKPAVFGYYFTVKIQCYNFKKSLLMFIFILSFLWVNLDQVCCSDAPKAVETPNAVCRDTATCLNLLFCSFVFFCLSCCYCYVSDCLAGGPMPQIKGHMMMIKSVSFCSLCLYVFLLWKHSNLLSLLFNVQ